MPQLIQTNIDDLKGECCTFWSAGNHPTQLLNGSSTDEVLLHLKALYLLSDKILATASFFFESELTREVTQKLILLFKKGDILYFVDESIEDFTEHGVRKGKKSPTGLVYYHDKDLVLERARSLNALGRILRRPNLSISDRLVELWIEDIHLPHAGTLGELLNRIIKGESARMKLQVKLAELARNRSGKDFVWAYVRPKLEDLRLPPDFLRLAQRRLSQMYAIATANLLGVSLDRNESSLSTPYITAKSRFDTSLFLACMEMLQVTEHLRKIKAADLVKLKASSEFSYFSFFYLGLIESVDYNIGNIRRWMPTYKDAELSFKESGVTINQFLQSFTAMCKARRVPANKYAHPIDILLHTYDSVNKLTIGSFIERIATIAKGRAKSTTKARKDADINDHSHQIRGGIMSTTIRKVFIGHGHSGAWRELMDFIQNRLKLCPDEFNREPTAGISTTERLETMLNDACFAFLVMTAEDEHADTSLHARENVIHEAGLFQGHLSFRQAIVMLEEGCKPFSNIAGLGQIRFPKGNIKAAFEDVRAVLEREGVL